MMVAEPWRLNRVHRSFASLRVCDFFEVAKNRCCKQSGYDDQIIENSKKSQALRMTVGLSTETLPAVSLDSPALGRKNRRASLGWRAEGACADMSISGNCGLPQ